MREHVYIYSFLSVLLLVAVFVLGFSSLDAFATDKTPLRDPTTPPFRVGGEAYVPGLVVSSVIYSPSRRAAVVNDVAVSEGDEVDGVKILAITKTGVTVRKGPQKLFVPVVFGTIKQAI